MEEKNLETVTAGSYHEKLRNWGRTVGSERFNLVIPVACEYAGLSLMTDGISKMYKKSSCKSVLGGIAETAIGGSLVFTGFKFVTSDFAY